LLDWCEQAVKRRRREKFQPTEYPCPVIAFFEERRGRLYGFRWRDRLDHSSAAPDAALAPTDQVIGTGDGTMATFAQCKTFELSRLASAYARNSSLLPSRARRSRVWQQAGC